MRGGGALCAESEAWDVLEKYFGRIYVPHPADEEILTALGEMANDPNVGFLLVLVGMPGSGKTLLLKEFVEALRYNHFSNDCKSVIDKVTKAFEFRDSSEILPFKEREKKGDYPTKKRIVWVTTAIDDFVDVSAEAEESLRGLERKLDQGMGKGESLIIFGNRGILGDVVSKEDPVIHSISRTVEIRNKRFEFIRIPQKGNVFWIKQFGIEEPLFNLTNGLQGFEQYSSALIRLAEGCLRKCCQGKESVLKCKDCLADIFLRYVVELKELLEDSSFTSRVHDLLFFLWLRHCDVYLTPRSLNLFWGYCLYNLWRLVEQLKQVCKYDLIDRSLIYHALYLSRLPSIRGPEEYSLFEAKVHRYRDEEFEREVLSRYEKSLLDKDNRARERLKRFFSRENVDFRRMIDNGALEEYSDSERLLSIMGQVLSKLVLMRRSTTVKTRKLGEIRGPSWGPEKLLFAPIVELVERRRDPERPRTHQKARRLFALMFDDRLLRDITYHGFAIVEDNVRYLEMREKFLELDCKVRDKRPKSPPQFNLNLQDYEILRDFVSRIGEPDLSLSPGLNLKVRAFLRNINGTADYLVAPLLTDYLRERSRRNNEVGLLVRSLKHGRDCDIEIADAAMRLSVNGDKYTIDIGESS